MNQSSGTFAFIGNSTAPHEYSTATLLPDGTVLIAGSELPDGYAVGSRSLRSSHFPQSTAHLFLVSLNR
jgi:hypothetical protein